MIKLKDYLSVFSLLVVFAFAIIACDKDDDNDEDHETFPQNYFAVANRVSNTITYHNTSDLTLLGTTTLPNGTQPTYVAYSAKKDKLYTGGFESGVLYEINSETYAVERSIDVGLGAFHLWLNDTVDQLWVNNINGSVKTTTVVDLNSFTVSQTIGLPTGLGLSSNAVQHDVIITPSGDFAYVTVLDGANTSHLVQYSTSNFSVVNTLQFGGDGHLGYFNNYLYTLSQNAGEIKQHNPANLTVIATIPFLGSHGVTASSTYLFAADLPDGRLGVIDAQNTVIATANTSFDATHNLAINSSGDKLFVSYSGATQTKVALFDVASNGQLTLNTTLDSGTNPFGVAYIQK